MRTQAEIDADIETNADLIADCESDIRYQKSLLSGRKDDEGVDDEVSIEIAMREIELRELEVKRSALEDEEARPVSHRTATAVSYLLIAVGFFSIGFWAASALAAKYVLEAMK